MTYDEPTDDTISDQPVDEAGTAGHPTDPAGPEGSVGDPMDSAPQPGQVQDGPGLTHAPTPSGACWSLQATGDYAGDEGVLMAALRDTLAGFGVQSATFTSSWGEDFDVSNPHV